MKIKIYFSSFYIISIFLILHFPFSYENSIIIKVHQKNYGRMELIKYGNRNCPSRINDGYNDNYSTDKCNPDIANGDHTLTLFWGDNDKLWDLSYMFEGQDTITEVNLYYLTPENINNMKAMFKNCKNLKKVTLPYII